MTKHPCKCLLCGEHPLLNDDGSHVEEVYVYQRINGKLQLAIEFVLDKPIYFAHAECPG